LEPIAVKLDSRSYGELLGEVVRTQIKLKDQATVFGLLWSLLNPVLMLGVMLLFFRARMSEGVDSYALYLLIGIVHYTHFANSTSASMTVLQSLKALTKNAIFPKEILVLGTVLSRSLELLISIAFCALVASFSGLDLTASVVGLPLVLALQLTFALWVSLVVAGLYVFVRDLRHVYQVFLRLLFFVTPIFYAPEFVGDGVARRIVELNPLAQIIQVSRDVLITGEVTDPTSALSLLAFNVAAFAITLSLFRRVEPRFAENV
jgi:ABC-type polysaccharide/polyol phosphate export permease